MQTLSSLATELTDRYGPVLTTSEVASLFKYHHKTVQLISDTDLPRKKMRGRGGNRYLAADVAKYMIDHLFPRVTSTDHRLVSSVMAGRPTPLSAPIEEKIRAAGETAASFMVKLAKEYRNRPFEIEIAIDKLGIDAHAGAAMVELLDHAGLAVKDVFGFYTLSEDAIKAMSEGGVL